MSEDYRISDANGKRRRKKHFAVLPYLVVPIVFVLVSLIIFVPFGKIVFNKAVETVHKAQEGLTVSYNDLSVDNQAVEFSNNDGIVVKSPVAAQILGTVKCESMGLYTDVYYGLNRVSLRNGAALKGGSSLFGQEGQAFVFGYSSTAFKALKNAEVGDIITVETCWGEYSYSVEDVKISEKSPNYEGNVLVLSSDIDDGAFSCKNKEKRYVAARQISGPAVKEVSDEP